MDPASAGMNTLGESTQPASALLKNKLVVPRLPPGIVLRPRLMERISAGAAGRVTLVSAGPGWGKTMMVAAWARARPSTEPVAWLSLDSFDNDPAMFWSYLAAAVHSTGEVPDGALGALRIRPPVSRDLVRRIIVTLGQLPRRLTLVLDDFGEIHDRPVLDGVRDLVRHPLPLRLIIVTRTDPGLHLHRLRVAGELTEVRAADLAFTEQESDAFLEAAGVALPADLKRRLHTRTEGWAAGLRLASLFVMGQGDAARSEQFADADTGVAEYFAEEVMAALPAERRRFMVRTSVADRLCGDLADALSGDSGGQRELEALEQANAFVVSLGSGNEWFRYHALFAEVLRHRLRLDEPDQEAHLHHRAALWFAARDEAVDAVRHAVRARDWQLVGELVVTIAFIRAVSSDRQAFAALLAEIPQTVIGSSPELRVTGAVACFLARDYAGFANHVAHARTMLSQRDSASRRPVEAFLAVADMVVGRTGGDIRTLMSAARQLLQWLSEPPMTGSPTAALYEAPALSNLGVGLVWSARIDEAEDPLRVSLGAAADTSTTLTAVDSLGYLAMIEMERGHLRGAHAIATEGREEAERRGWTELAQVIAIYLVLAQTELEWNNPLRAQRMLDAGLAAQHNDPERMSYPALQATQASVWLASGQVARARQAMHALDVDTSLPTVPRLVRRRLARVNAEVDLAGGHAHEALDRLDQALSRDEGAHELRVCRSRARLALGDTAAAETELAAIPDTSNNPLVVTQAWLLTAIAADHRRDDHRAMSALDRAVENAQPENIRRPFIALGDHRLEAMLRHRLRRSSADANGTRSFTAQILDEIGPAGPASVVVTPLAEPLTDREHVVLSHLATLKTNEEIAAELYISVNTVKAHARGVYRKLDVPNRRGAVSRARDLGLL